MGYKTFSGTDSQYRTLHDWVERQLGKPMKCSRCSDETKSRYDWANISGLYKKDISDWERLCRPCHLRQDFKKDVCPSGHALSVDNLYFDKRGYGTCHICKSKSNREYARRKRGLQS